MIVEWSYHMWHTDTDRYPINPDTTYDPRPLSDQTFGSDDPVGDYLDRMDEVGIDRAVLVQPEPYIGDHSLVLDCVSEEPDRLRATSYGRLYLCTGDRRAFRRITEMTYTRPCERPVRDHARRRAE